MRRRGLSHTCDRAPGTRTQTRTNTLAISRYIRGESPQPAANVKSIRNVLVIFPFSQPLSNPTVDLIENLDHQAVYNAAGPSYTYTHGHTHTMVPTRLQN